MLQQIRDKLQSRDPDFDTVTLLRGLAGLLALAGMLLPWIQLDGAASAMNAAELLAYSFTNPERGAMIDVSFIGTIALLFVPPILITITCLTFISLIKGEHPFSMNTTALILIAALVLLTGPVISSDQSTLWSVPIPKAGVMVVALSHAGLITHGAWLERKKSERQKKEAQKRAAETWAD